MTEPAGTAPSGAAAPEAAGSAGAAGAAEDTCSSSGSARSNSDPPSGISVAGVTAVRLPVAAGVEVFSASCDQVSASSRLRSVGPSVVESPAGSSPLGSAAFSAGAAAGSSSASPRSNSDPPWGTALAGSSEEPDGLEPDDDEDADPADGASSSTSNSDPPDDAAAGFEDALRETRHERRTRHLQARQLGETGHDVDGAHRGRRMLDRHRPAHEVTPVGIAGAHEHDVGGEDGLTHVELARTRLRHAGDEQLGAIHERRHGVGDRLERDAFEVELPHAGLEQVGERSRCGLDDAQHGHVLRQRFVERCAQRLEVALLRQLQLEVLGLGGGPRRRGVRVRDTRVRVEACGERHRHPRATHGTLEGALEVTR